MTVNLSDYDIKSLIKEAVTAGMTAGRVQANKVAGDAYKATERRLYAYVTLLEKVEDDKARLKDLQENGVSRSKSVVRFNRPGTRLSPDEILEALVADTQATIAADEYEVSEIAAALHSIEGDQYYLAVYGKYVECLSDEMISEKVHCDPSTVRRNRGRLVRTLAVRLYGSEAIE